MPSIEISDAAFAFLKSRAEPFIDTTLSVVDRLIAEIQKGQTATGSAKALEMQLSGDHLPSVKFTNILKATVAGKPASQQYWNNILDDVIATAVAAGAQPEKVRAMLAANTVEGLKSDAGYRPIKSAGFSYQGLEANRVMKNLGRLCEAFGVNIDVRFVWHDNEQAAHPGRTARLVLP